VVTRSDLLGQVLAGMPADFAAPSDDYRATRAKMAPLHGHPLAPDTVVRTTQVGRVPATWLSTPATDPARGAVLFLHGGAFVSCSMADYLFYAEFIAQWIGVPVLTLDYRLAPEHPFPAAIDDCLSGYRGMVVDGHAPQRVLLIGDSCGGGLVLATALLAREHHLPGPGGVISLSGWVDLDTAGYGPEPSDDRDPFISEGFLRARAADYLTPGGDPHRPAASPARGDPTGLPPLLLQVGETDLCRIDAELLHLRAVRAGVAARLDVVEGGVHGVQGLVNLGVPEAVAAWTTVGEFADELLGR
jgi:acetyl esterase/lipase